MIPLLERIGFIVLDQQAANQPLIKTKPPNASQNVDAHHHHISPKIPQHENCLGPESFSMTIYYVLVIIM
jgi:hypothetical protein